MLIEFLRPTALAGRHHDIGDQATVGDYLGRQLLAGTHPKARPVEVPAAADPAGSPAEDQRIKPDEANRAEVIGDPAPASGLTTTTAAAVVKKGKK